MANKKVSAILRKAVYEGLIQKPNQCQKCKGVFPKRKIYGHHQDYTKPYDVIWLCYACHHSIEKVNGKRIKFLKGQPSYNRKLSANQVKQIRELYKKGITGLAKTFGLDRKNIYRITHGLSYRELPTALKGMIEAENEFIEY